MHTFLKPLFYLDSSNQEIPGTILYLEGFGQSTRCGKLRKKRNFLCTDSSSLSPTLFDCAKNYIYDMNSPGIIAVYSAYTYHSLWSCSSEHSRHVWASFKLKWRQNYGATIDVSLLVPVFGKLKHL